MIKDNKTIEKKWQKIWSDKKIFEINLRHKIKNKFYILDMFPYPSGPGLHLGHARTYIASDLVHRYKKMSGYTVFRPIGWDAFGLPAEQYAIETGNNPALFTIKNINKFRSQLKKLGLSYDYRYEINTSDPHYYRWTQWIFSRMFEKGLAKEKNVKVNWCPYMQTVLADEEVKKDSNNKTISQRGGHLVIKKNIRHWVLLTTKYIDKFLENISQLDWPKRVKESQKEWIGLSNGWVIKMKILESQKFVEIFTTKPNVLADALFVCLNPSHKLLTNPHIKKRELKNLEEKKINNDNIEGYFTGMTALNPFNNKKLPIWCANYINEYATGAIMGVPLYNKYDYLFANKYKNELGLANYSKHSLSIINTTSSNQKSTEKKESMEKFLKENKYGYKANFYRLKDWVFSRQRYWGEPIPIIHKKNTDGSIDSFLEKKLPVVLPSYNKIKLHTDDFEKNHSKNYSTITPLSRFNNWVNISNNLTRETNVMPQWAGSSWYYIGYLLKDTDEKKLIPLNTKTSFLTLKKWLPVDLYVGGHEYSNSHYLYARFWHKFLYDQGIVSTKEPFKKLFCQGMVLGKDGKKMSKSANNFIKPEELISEYSVDALRLALMFKGPLKEDIQIGKEDVRAAQKWIKRVITFFSNPDNITDSFSNPNSEKKYSKLVENVSKFYEKFFFNRIIAQFMEFINSCYKIGHLNKKHASGFIKMLNPITPHICEELWKILGHQNLINEEKWPNQPSLKISDSINLIVQLDGKLVLILKCKKDSNQITIENKIMKKKKMINRLSKLHVKKIKKTIFIKNKLINFVS